MADYRIRITVDPSGAAAGSRAAANEVGKVGDAADRANRRVGGLMDELSGLGGAFKIAGVIAGIAAFARLTDEVKQANAQLKLATRTQEELNKAQEAAYTIAQRNGTAYGATATLLAKNLKAANALGITGTKAASMAENATRAVAAGIRVSGTNAEEARGSLIQLGQALASGVLRGDELNSVMEGIPAVGEAIAKAMGHSAGELRALGAAGKLTSGEVLKALDKAAPQLEKLASMIPLTFGGAMEKVKNSFAGFLSAFDSNTSLSAGMIAALDLVSRTLDTLKENAQAVSNIIIGVFVALGAKMAATFRAGAVAAAAQAAENLAVARTAQAAALAEAELAAASAARAGASLVGGGAAAAAEVAAAAAKVKATSLALKEAEVAASAAASGATLFGRAFQVAARVINFAIGSIGGGIGAIIIALTALVLWAGKAALSFQPIKGEAGTVSDYIAVAFSDAMEWTGKKFGEFSEWSGKKLSEIGTFVRPVVAFMIDAFLNAGRAIAGVVNGIVEAWKAGAGNIAALIAGMGSDASNAMKGNFTISGTTNAIANSKSMGAAFGKGVQDGFNGTFKGLSGDKVITDTTNFVKSIPDRISKFAKSSGLEERANARAKARAEAEKGGLGAPGKPVTPPEKKKGYKANFADILKQAQEEAAAAALTTAERERQEKIIQTQKTLHRDLTDLEKAQLVAAIKLRQENEANLALTEGAKDALEAQGVARVKALADAARAEQDFSKAADLDAEAAVEERVNAAKRAGITLDKDKLDGYRQAVAQAAREADETARMVTERKRNLDLVNATKDALENAQIAKLQAAGDARRDVRDFNGAALIAGEIAVQEKLNQAKRDGVTLDATKLETYRQAVIEATKETDVVKQQQEARRALQQIADDARNSIREAISGGIYDALSGKFSLGSIFKSFGDILKKQFAEQITYSIFQSGMGVDQSTVTGQAVSIVTPAAAALAEATNKVTAALTPANDNNPVAAAMDTGAAQVKAATEKFSGTISGAANPLAEAIRGLLGVFGLAGKGTLLGASSTPTTGIGKFFGPQGPIAGLTNKVGKFLGLSEKTDANGGVINIGQQLLSKVTSGLALGNAAGGILNSLGIKTSSTGSSLGGVAGSFIGGPLGAAIGGAIGGVLGGLFKKTDRGSAQITSTTSPAIINGNTSSVRSDLGGAATSVQQAIQQIADGLGATVGPFAVSINKYKDSYRVDPSGGTSVGGKYGDKDGVIKFDNNDLEGAIRAAIADAIKDGAIQGLSAGVSEALRSGRATVQEVADFGLAKKDIDNRAKALTDPVGAAIDQLDDKYNALRRQYAKFGESTVNLEKLYQDERAKVIADATKQELSSLKQFRDELRGGDLGNKSLSEQVAFQDAAFKQIEAASASGGKVDTDQLNTVGRALLDATRQLEGNTPAYQAQVDRVMAILNKVLDPATAPNVSVLNPNQIDTSSIVSATDETTKAVQDQTTQLADKLNQVGAAVVKMSDTLASKLDAMGNGSYDEGRYNYRVADF